MANLSNINNKFLVTTGGDVGIGITAPSEKLSVNGNISLNRYLSLSNSDYTYILGKRTSPSDGFYLTRLMGYGDNTFYGSFDVLRHDADDGELRFRTRTAGTITDVMTIVDGNVEIGANYTNAKLSVGGNLAILNTKQLNLTGTLDSDLLWYGMRYDNNEVQIYTYYPSDRSITFNTVSGGTGITTQLMKIETGGNVGIGTISPNFKLGLSNSTALTAVYQQFTNGTTGTTSSDGTVMGIDADGDFLINNQEAKEIKLYTSDTQRLTIESDGDVLLTEGNLTMSGNTPFIVLSNTAETESGITFVDSADAGQSAKITYDASGNSLIFYNNASSERMRINSDGRVGINTTVFPSSGFAKLVVAGGAIAARPSGVNDYFSYIKSNWEAENAFEIGIEGAGTQHRFITSGNYYYGTELRFWTSDTQRVTINSVGNVGIGETNPGTKLTVKHTDDTFNDLDLLQLKRVWSTASGNDRSHGISFSDTNAALAKIYANRYNSGSNYGGKLEFYVNLGTNGTSVYEAVSISNAATLQVNPQASSYGIRQNGVSNISNSGYVNGNATLSLTYDCDSQGSMFIECVFNHYGFISTYGCARIATVANGPNIQVNDIQNISSGNGGSWTFTRVSNTQFTIAKTAGTYGGAGHYFVNIRGNGVKYT